MVFQSAPLFIPGVPGGPELLIILFIAVLLFGANKIPKLARSTGEAMGEFRKGREKAEHELQEMREMGTTDETEAETTYTEPESVSTSEDRQSPVQPEMET